MCGCDAGRPAAAIGPELTQARGAAAQVRSTFMADPVGEADMWHGDSPSAQDFDGGGVELVHLIDPAIVGDDMTLPGRWVAPSAWDGETTATAPVQVIRP